ncbi:MAG: DPP IV N-terminal domain-containing protein [Gemmatimonadaceae bacterium]
MSGLSAKWLVPLLLGLAPVGLNAQGAQQSERETIYRRYFDFASYVKGGSIQPHWMADGSSFWFAEGEPINTVIWKIDPNSSTRTRLFDTARLRSALTRVLGHEPAQEGLPFTDFEFLAGDRAVRFSVENADFVLELDTYEITRRPAPSEEANRFIPRVIARGAGGIGWPDVVEVLSQDRRWFAAIRDYNVWLRSSADGRDVQLTNDGVEGLEWRAAHPGSLPYWSPDSRKLVVRKIDFRGTPQIPIVEYLDQPERVEWAYYPKAGERRAVSELFVIDIVSGQRVGVDSGEEPVHQPVMWRPDRPELLFLKTARYNTQRELMAADINTGSTRRVILDWDSTSIPFPVREPPVTITLLADGRKFVWMSERDGWKHLYLYDLDGTLVRRLTQGSFPVVRLVAVDEQSDWVYFTAQSDPARPYDVHFCRVTLDGLRFEQLTQTPGHHEIRLAPSKQFFLDSHSSVDRPPVVELRRADGSLLQIVSRADTSALMRELRWRPPEEFVVKAADGVTDLHGVLYKPYDLDPSRKYPILQTFGAPSEPPRTFIPGGLGFGAHALSMAHLGYIVVVVNGRGTAGRGVAFGNADRGHHGRLETADRVAALRQLAATRPFMELTRVGVLGGSYGGFMSVRAMLFAPDVYSVGVAINPITDMAAHWRNELFLGPPQDRDGYEYASNVRFAGDLKGKLLLIAGTSDRDVPIFHTMRMAQALIQAGKPFDMLILPGQPHVPTGVSWSALIEATRRHFDQHLRPE